MHGSAVMYARDFKNLCLSGDYACIILLFA